VRISGFHIEGFGALADFGVEDLSPGLVIISGPNEAGKSTLLDFITAMLFGFPNRRDNARFRAPVRGGRHGGQLTLAEGHSDRLADDRKWHIERYSGPRKELRIRRSDTGPASEDDLRRALGGADEALFRAVFAVDLSDLGSAEAMTRDDVRELLFSASIVGQRRSAARAMSDLQKQRLELARPRQGDARANRLWAELETLRRGLAEAGREAAEYPARQAALLHLEGAVTEARQATDEMERRTRELDLLVRLWDVLDRKRDAERHLAIWEEPDPLATWLEQHTVELQALRSACSGHVERAAQLADLRNQRVGIEQSLQVALGSLGPDWDRDRVRTGGGWIGLVDDARRFHSELSNRQAQWHTARALADEAGAAPELDHLPERDESEMAVAVLDMAASTVQPEEQAKLLNELRKNLAEQRRLVAEGRVEQRRGGDYSTRLEKTAGALFALIALVIVALATIVALAPGRPLVRLLGAGLAALAACALVALAVATRRRAYSVGPGEQAGVLGPLERVAGRVVELATALSLPASPSDSDVETLAERVEVARSLQRSLEDDRRRRIAALERSKAVHESLQRATDELATEQARFGGWKAAQGLAAKLSPDGVLQSLSTLQAASKDIAALERVDARIDQRCEEISRFQDRISKLAAELAELGGPAQSLEIDPLATLEDLCSSSQEAFVKRAAKTSLLRTIEDARAELDRSLGLGPESRRLRTELEAGELLEWEEERAGLAQSRSELRDHLEQLVRAHQDASNELRDLAGSTRIAELEQQRLALEQELDDVLRSWAVLGCARLLLERTLRRHEQERQPAVLARAGERFAKVTEGRYTCLLPTVGEEASRDFISVLSSSGNEIDATQLSRGTVEQLYLCLRLGLAETFAERAEALPLILDDVLVNFDPSRAASVAEALADTAQHHQVLFLTCHPHLEQLMRQVTPETQVVELERI